MAYTTVDNDIVMERDYTDNFSIKKTAMDTLGPKYFEGIDLSGLNVGELGFVLEQMANMTEDAFNTSSMLIHEIFPNQAIIPESIYSHAAIFQLDNSFSQCASCSFVMLLDQKEIINYGDTVGNRTSFFIDKNTVITVEDIPFTLDYDIKIEAIKKQVTGSDTDYNFSARYVLDSDNSISQIHDPYLKIRKASNGLLILILTAHQVERTEIVEKIISNTKINYPVLEFEFTGDLAGFDIFYRSPSDTEYIQLTKLIKFSLPLKSPFCFYKLKNDGLLEITFSSRDGYFQPKFNSEIKIVMYTTKGKAGNFETYNGSNIELLFNTEKYVYNDKLTVALKPVSESMGGNDRLSLDGLRALTVESYSNATELSIESDIMRYFYNYKYRYNNEILVVKRRDDITERLFSAFLLMKNNDYIYPTNTLHLDMADSDYDIIDGVNKFTLRPGHVFVYKEGSLNTLRIIPGIMAYETDKVNELFDQYPFVYTNPFLISMTKNPNLVGLYKSIVEQTVILDYISSNDDSFIQFITSKINIHRGITDSPEYTITLDISPSSSMDQYIHNLNTNEGNDVRVIVSFIGSNGLENGLLELVPTYIDPADVTTVTFSAHLATNDYINSKGEFPALNATKINSELDYSYIPISNASLNVYVLYRDGVTEVNMFTPYLDDVKYFTVTNKYSTSEDKVTFIEPLNMMRSTVTFSNSGTFDDPVVHSHLSLLPMLKADIIQDNDSFNVFVEKLTSNYNYMEEALSILRNNTHIDIKFYNTYGKSSNYFIGDHGELIDKVNIGIKFIITTMKGTDEIEIRDKLKEFIKEFIEQVNSSGTNELYISNLIRQIETEFSNIHHLKFMGINDYSTDYQTISIKEPDIENLSKDERRNYVPEILVIDKNDIRLSIFSN